MAFLFGAPHPKHHEVKDAHSVFHGDADLHDQRPGAMKWFQNLGSDIPAALRLAAGKFGAEAAVAECARLPLNDALSKYLTGQSVNTLWGSLLHPPLSYRGNLLQYRTADGSANSFLHPQLGKAGEPYAKSVPAEVAVQGARPDPGDLFDLLMAPQGDGKRSTSKLGISSMLLYHATIIIHDIFRSNKDDKNLSDTSSYLDLTPLYGRSRIHQEAIRQMKDGLLKPDSFAEERLLHQPPGVCIYLIMYSRFHNYVAQQLKTINENGKFSLPPKFKELSKEDQEEAEKKIDEDLFQTARLITCGLYINISIHDYLRVLMRLHAKDTPWTLDPRIEIPEAKNKEGIQRGIGNQVSCEFNMLYRFHSPISNRDSKWTDDFLRKSFAPLVAAKKLTPEQLEDLDIPVELMRMAIGDHNESAAKAEEKAIEGAQPDNAAKPLPFMPEGLGFRGRDPKTGKPVGEFPFARDPKTGKFNDDQLVKEMVNVLNDPICNFGPQNTPRAFKAIEIMGILQARKWELATLNEFRDFFGLPKHTRFEDINGDKKVQDALRDLYGDPDMVELYPGLFCEGGGDYNPKTGKSSKLDPGTSCPGGRGTALWRGVFSDAITLVRSDRFYTIDWNVASLTAWGMKEVTSDPDILKGSVFHRLWQRAFPGHFKYNSVMLWQPFYTPMKNLEIAATQSNYLDLLAERKEDLEPNPDDPDHVWMWKNQSYPAKRPAPIIITDYKTIFDIVQGDHSKLFANPGVLDSKAIPGKALQQVMSADGTIGDLSEALGNLINEKEQALIQDYFHDMSKTITLRERRQMQKRKSGEDYVYQIDIIKDYAVPVITRFVADILGFGHEIKTEEHMDRKYDENQIYKHFTHCHDFLTFNADDTTAWKRRVEFTKSMKFLQELTEHAVEQAQPGLFEPIFGERSYGTAQDGDHVKHVRRFGVKMARHLVKEKRKSKEEAAAIMLYTAIDATYKSVLIFANVLSYFLEQSNVKHWTAIQNLATQKVKTPKEYKDVNDELLRYVMEAQRINADFWIVRTFRPAAHTRSMNVKTVGADGKTHETTLRGSEQLVLKVKPASQNAHIFHKPQEVHLHREQHKYIYYGSAPNSKFTAPKLTILAITGMIKYAAKLRFLRLAHDTAGRLKTAATPDGWGERYLSPQWDQLLPFPTTWNLRFDGPEEGTGVYDGPDNSKTGNSSSQMFSLDKPSAVGGTLNTFSVESRTVVNGSVNGYSMSNDY